MNAVCCTKIPLILILGSLSGCSLGKNYSEINPEGAKADARKHNGYHALKAVKPGKAKLVLRGEGAPRGVEFFVSTASAACQDFKSIGIARDTGHGAVYSWIAKTSDATSRGKPFIQKEVTPGQRIQVQGHGTWHENMNVVGADIPLPKRCGPLVARFTPEADHAYLVQFMWVDQDCKLVISDATHPDSPLSLPVEPIQGCPNP